MIILSLLGTVLASLAALAVYVYYHSKGHFENTEDVKYQIFREDND